MLEDLVALLAVAPDLLQEGEDGRGGIPAALEQPVRFARSGEAHLCAALLDRLCDFNQPVGPLGEELKVLLLWLSAVRGEEVPSS